eukprot:TRINITY_DN26389_c0_g4_i1.p1 TRINITY_DN26389_c0_g4~~TRINITY_DN26389_c0_g4_i1.p1  ORF type:complete len:895 (-),score=216.50 TRINITY_DN26389_c0_g4_i1:67-2751(-)
MRGRLRPGRLAVLLALGVIASCVGTTSVESADAKAVAGAEEALRAAMKGLSGKAGARKVAAIKLTRALEGARKLGVAEALLREGEQALQGATAADGRIQTARAGLTAAVDANDAGKLREALRLAKEAGLTKGSEVAAAEKALAPLEKAEKKAGRRELKKRKALEELKRLLAPDSAAGAPSADADALRTALATARRLVAGDGGGTPSPPATDDVEAFDSEDELLRAAAARLETLEWEALPLDTRLDRTSVAFGRDSCQPPREPPVAGMCQRLSPERLIERSRATGEANCNHPTLLPGGEAEKAPLPNALPPETSKNFCRYPPRYNLRPAEDGKGFYPVAFEFPPKLFNLTAIEDETMADLAVINLDMNFFRYGIAACGGDEVWLIEFYVHWCPHCMQVMPEFYRLGVALRSAGARLRIGAVNCATQKDLCGAFQVIGHPMIAFFYGGVGADGQVNLFEYRGRDVRVNSALDAVKQNRNPAWDAGAPKDFEIPKHLFPAESAVDLVGLLPEEYKPSEAVLRWLANSTRTRASVCPERREWHDASANARQADNEQGENAHADSAAEVAEMPDGAAAATSTAEQAVSKAAPLRRKSFPGDGWPAWEHAATAAHRNQDAAQALVYTLEEWVAPNPAGQSPHAFAYAELRDLRDWVAFLRQAFPTVEEGGLDLHAPLAELEAKLAERLQEIEAADGRGALCIEEWKRLVWPVRRAFDKARAGKTLLSLCRTETCRVWALLHTLSVCSFARSNGTAEVTKSSNGRSFDLMSGFLRRYFTCRTCRAHFLEQWEAGSYDLAAARVGSPKDLALWWWRLHVAVSTRVAAEGKCKADRRWPAADVCPDCWPSSSSKGKAKKADFTVADEALVAQTLVRQYWPTPRTSSEGEGGEESSAAPEITAS